MAVERGTVVLYQPQSLGSGVRYGPVTFGFYSWPSYRGYWGPGGYRPYHPRYGGQYGGNVTINTGDININRGRNNIYNRPANRDRLAERPAQPSARPSQPSTRPSSPRPGTLNRDVQSRQRGAQRSNNFQRSRPQPRSRPAPAVRGLGCARSDGGEDSPGPRRLARVAHPTLSMTPGTC
jgi:hypothetical protein